VRVCICLSVEMGDKSAVQQQKQPPYDGLCNYAQKITSCFGLDGKHRPSVFFYVIYVFILYRRLGGFVFTLGSFVFIVLLCEGVVSDVCAGAGSVSAR